MNKISPFLAAVMAVVLGPVGVVLGPGGALAPRAALAHQGHKKDGVNALYATKGEAEAAAKRFHCTGTHQMGDKWMPCAMAGDASGH